MQQIQPQPSPSVPQAKATPGAYLASKAFWRLLGLLVIGGLLLLAALLFGLLPLYTRHGAAVTVPEVNNKLLDEAEEALHAAGLKAEVIDSQFFANLPPRAIITQDPGALDKVKPGRTVYLVVNKTRAPAAKLPDIIEVNFQQAKYLLENWGLRVGQLSYVPGDARDLVVKASYQGLPIKPGDTVQVGAKIDLVISRGQGQDRIEVPNIVGMTLGEATSVLNDLGLGVGGVRYGTDRKYKEAGIVFRQKPEKGTQVLQGYAVDLTVTGRRILPQEGATP